MRTTLRRSCNACAKAKHSCDLQKPQCSRCIKRKANCVYTNEPLTSPIGNTSSSSSASPETSTSTVGKDELAFRECFRTSVDTCDNSVVLSSPAAGSFDPFDSYPPTRLPRIHVQRLIQHFLSNIAFQYYPLDLDLASNPFVVSWWPLALADPALFHVSIQTASLDEELRAQKGFLVSEILMNDSVSLVRQKIENSSLAFQNETMNSVVTLAAIEHGKGNVETSMMHIDGVKRMVNVRGGINQVKRTSPLTARMVAWVSMLVATTPQFQTQEDLGEGVGICPTLQWLLTSGKPTFQDRGMNNLDLDSDIRDVLIRLRKIFRQAGPRGLMGTELHDLTCFVIHKLLLLPPSSPTNTKRSDISESFRLAMALYMLVIHGTTYYSHLPLASRLMAQLRYHLEALSQTNFVHEPSWLWLLSIGIVTTMSVADYEWLTCQALTAAGASNLGTWQDIRGCLEGTLWMETHRGDIFKQKWEEILSP